MAALVRQVGAALIPVQKGITVPRVPEVQVIYLIVRRLVGRLGCSRTSVIKLPWPTLTEWQMFWPLSVLQSVHGLHGAFRQRSDSIHPMLLGATPPLGITY